MLLRAATLPTGPAAATAAIPILQAKFSCTMHSPYFWSATICSYGTFIIVSAAYSFSQDEKEDKYPYHGSALDIPPPFAIQFGLGGYLSLGSIVGLTTVGHQKRRIFYKCLLYDLGILILTSPFYFVPPLSIIPVLAVLAIPIINFNIAYSIDKNYMQTNIDKMSLQPYFGLNKAIKTVGVLIHL